MNLISNQRPGVYSRYDISSAYTAPQSGGYAAVVAKATGGEVGTLYTFTTLAQLGEVFSPDQDGAALRGCAEILLRSGVSQMYAVAVAEDYPAAFDLVSGLENVTALVCDCEKPEQLAAMKASVDKSAGALRERVGYCGLAGTQGATEAATALNSERMVLCCPAVAVSGGTQRHAAYGAAALAGRVLAQNDCTYNFSGEPLDRVEAPERLPEEDVQSLLACGVTVLEQSGGQVECVRALTTRTRSGGETDYALRGLNTILYIDSVMQGIRASLRASLRGVQLTTRSLHSIQSQVVVELAEKADRGVIESFDTPKVYSDKSDPTVCVVELAFHVAHVISQIHVTAHIQV